MRTSDVPPPHTPDLLPSTASTLLIKRQRQRQLREHSPIPNMDFQGLGR